MLSTADWSELGNGSRQSRGDVPRTHHQSSALWSLDQERVFGAIARLQAA